MPLEHTEIKSMTRLLMSILETQSSFYCNFGNKNKGVITLQLATILKRPPLIPTLDMPYMPFYDQCNLIVQKWPTIYSICLISYQS